MDTGDLDVRKRRLNLCREKWLTLEFPLLVTPQVMKDRDCTHHAVAELSPRAHVSLEFSLQRRLLVPTLAGSPLILPSSRPAESGFVSARKCYETLCSLLQPKLSRA